MVTLIKVFTVKMEMSSSCNYLAWEERGAYLIVIEPWHGISNSVVCATSKASDQPAHTHEC